MRTTLESVKLIELSNKIRTTRQSYGYTQTDLAELVGKDQSSIHRLESGKINPGYLFLQEIADALNIDLKELLP